jgi:tetratricopeptide (TPR) repeat protein
LNLLMIELEPPDNHHLRAAIGWLELGNSAEARGELDRIAPGHRNHPDVLEASWRIGAQEKDWTSALEIARRLVGADPANPAGWIHQSYSLHELKRTREAYDLLLPAIDQFPELSTIPYNLACYLCQLGDLDQARRWLARAVELRGKEDIKSVALADPDLKPMWEEIQLM